MAIGITYNRGNGTWGFFDTVNKPPTPIAKGDLTAGPGTNYFNFAKSSGETWTFVSFTIDNVTVTAPAVGLASATTNDNIFTITAHKNGVSLTDRDSTPTNQDFEYTFQINLNGEVITCDPKIYNKNS